MGGIPIQLSAWGMDCEVFDAVVGGFRGEIRALERMMSAHTAEGTVATINRGGPAGGPCPAELRAVLTAALEVSRATDGAFDVTVRPLLQAYKHAAREGRLPTDEEHAAAMARLGYDAIELEGERVRFTREGIGIDLGGIAKGYFGDVAVRRLRDAGATRCIADVGADLVTWRTASERPFQVGIRNPWGEGLMAVITVDGGAVVTSGDYERFVQIGDRRICHIVDPRTGQPVEGVHSVTVVAPTGVEADALATGIFVLGFERGSALVEGRADLEVVIVADDPVTGEQRVSISAGLRERFEWHGDVARDRPPTSLP
jgi:FAD:protein FMN transferase